eukprot:CAMPEP_0172930274 /NCGR_PEP_ID=MMETSP1075-20121228/218907_1 /TAXON_ID=2916 /ORGANISM="Ceratium fusus, Strain PA161109" /LENGTH=336 /DNA_ID=CAMNT_0013791583 /DNA_START=111 /DNA_END=1122 /DNA_ORIENTATION=-
MGCTQNAKIATEPATSKRHEDKAPKRGDFVCREAGSRILDARFRQKKGEKLEELEVETASGRVETWRMDTTVALFSSPGPQLAYNDVKGKNVEFRSEDGARLQGAVDCQTNTEVFVRLTDQNSAPKLQMWIPREDIYFLGQKRGIQVEDGARLQGAVDCQTNTEVFVRLTDQNSAPKLQMWIPREDIYFLHVMVFSASNLKNADYCTTSDPYVRIHLHREGRKQNTSADDSGVVGHGCNTTTYVTDNLNPTWNEDFRFPSVNDVTAIEFKVWDKDVNMFKSDDFLGSVKVGKEAWQNGKDEILELHLCNEAGEPMKEESKIRVRIKACGPSVELCL